MKAKINVKPSQSAAGQIILLEKKLSSLSFKIVSALFWLSGILAVLLTFLNFYYYPEEEWSGLCLILFSLFLIYLGFRFFYLSIINFDQSKDLRELKTRLESENEINLFDYFSLDLASATFDLFSQSQNNQFTLRNLAAALTSSKELNFILLRLGLSQNALSDLRPIGKSLGEPYLLRAIEIALAKGKSELGASDIFYSVCENCQAVKSLINELKLDLTDIENVIYWQEKTFAEIKKIKDKLNPDHLKMTGGFGKDWAYGFTNFLRSFSVDLTEVIQRNGLGLEVVGRDAEIRQIEEILQRQTGHNVVVVGDAGSGKRTTVLGFAKRIIEGNVPSSLALKHIFEVDVSVLLSGQYSDLGDRLKRVLEEASCAGNVVIFIQNIERILSAESIGEANLSTILLPYLDSGSVDIVATCDIANYNELISNNSALAQRFVRVSVAEPDNKNMIKILEDTTRLIEGKTGCLITYEAIKSTLKAADKYLLNLPNPEKSINLLDGVVTRTLGQRGQTIILPKDIDEFISEKFSLPSGDVEVEEKTKLLNLELILHKDVVGQAVAIEAISNALRRARTQVSNSKKPIGSFLFLGPTGVGKTATAKALAKAYFGGEEKMVRFDMSEYQNKADIYRLIGTPREEGILTTAIREKPFALLLFDEVEKSSPDVLNLFLQILDEGFLTDGAGKKVSFSNSIIIATSNAGAELIHQNIANNQGYAQIEKNLVDYLIGQKIFKPEFLNRFSGVIVFSPLALEEIKMIAALLVNKVAARVYQNQGIKITVSKEALENLAKAGFDPKMGARSMERVITEKIEDIIAKKILANELKQGDTFAI